METLSNLKTQSWLSWFLRGILCLGFLALFARIFDLQIIRGSYFRTLADENRIRKVTISAPRGEILARGGEVLVGNREVKKSVQFDEESGYKKVEATEVSGNEGLLSEWIRDYKLGATLGHVSGYVGEVNEEELGKIKGECPEKGPRKIGSYVGRTGLEEMYECVLSGTDGEELIEVDARGTAIRVLGIREPIPGENIRTTIDIGLQKKIAQTMSGKKGAAIATDKKGEILAFFSSPSYDPNIFADKKLSDNLYHVLNDINKPLFNRVMGGLFHPGSVYKPVVAIAALEEGKIDKDFTYDDTGQIFIESIYGDYSYKNWYFTQYGGTEGKIDLTRAIARSTDTFFYKVGELTGVENLVSWSEKFGLNQKTGIDLPGEISGLVPNPNWKLQEKGERWFLGNTYHMSIGQGDLAVTPIEINREISAISNGGKLCKPRLVKADGSEKEDCSEIGIKRENIDLVMEGMKGGCSEGGTAYTFFNFKEKSGVEVASKRRCFKA